METRSKTDMVELTIADKSEWRDNALVVARLCKLALACSSHEACTRAADGNEPKVV